MFSPLSLLCFGAFSLCLNTSNCVSLPRSFPSSLHPPVTLLHFPGAFKAKGMPSAPMARSGAFAETSAQYSNPFGSLAPSRGAISPTFGAADPTGETPLFLQLSHCPASMLQTAPVAPEMVQPVFARGNLQMARGKQMGVGMMQSGFSVRNSLGAGDAPSTFFLGNDPTGAGHFRAPQTRGGGSGVDETTNQNSNPFLF